MKKNTVAGIIAALTVTAGAGGVFAGYYCSENHSEKPVVESHQTQQTTQTQQTDKKSSVEPVSVTNNSVRQTLTAAKKASAQRKAAIQAARKKAAADKAAAKQKKAAEKAAAEKAAAEKAAAEKAAAEKAAAEKAAAEKAAAEKEAMKEANSDAIADVIDAAKESGIFSEEEINAKVAQITALYNKVCSTEEESEQRSDEIAEIIQGIQEVLNNNGYNF